MKNPPTPMPFFVGCGRSGTTLLRSIFDSHSELAVVHESRFVPEVLRRRRRYERNGLDSERFVRDLYTLPIGQSRMPELSLTADDLAQRLDRGGVSNLRDAVREIYRSYAEAEGKSRAGDKTPTYVLHIAEIAQLLPEARFVHLVRDGRDVALAYRDAHFGPNTPIAAALFWSGRIRAGRAAGGALGPERYREVRYEDLLDDPETVVRQLCDFIELEFEPAMLDYSRRASALVATTGGHEHHRHLDRPPTKGLRDWTSQLDRRSAVAFDVAAGPLLTDLGYHAVEPSPSGRERVDARMRLFLGSCRERARMSRVFARRQWRTAQWHWRARVPGREPVGSPR